EAAYRLAMLLESRARRHVKLSAGADELPGIQHDGILLLTLENLRRIDADRVARDPALLDEVEDAGRQADDLPAHAFAVDAGRGKEEIELELARAAGGRNADHLADEVLRLEERVRRARAGSPAPSRASARTRRRARDSRNGRRHPRAAPGRT